MNIAIAQPRSRQSEQHIPLVDENERLRRRIIELTERVSDLEDMLRPPVHIPSEWRLTAIETLVIRAIYAAAPHPVSDDRLLLVCHESGCASKLDVLKVRISQIRTKLPSPCGIARPVRHQGYVLTPATIEAIERHQFAWPIAATRR